jgi:ATP-dependent Clp endopeptidase proteolytic subunit ClpP
MIKMSTVSKMSDIEVDIYDEEPVKSKTGKKKREKEDIFNEIEYGIHINDSIVYLHGDIMLGNLFDMISKIRIILANRPKEKANDPINLLINTNGGDVYEALGIIDYMESLSVPVNVIARGRAMSAGAMILCCGTGKRIASKGTTIMVHEASAEIFGKSADIKANADHIDDLEEDFYQVMEKRTKQPADFWRKACRKDFYMSAEKAKELGIIDEII